MLPLLVCKVYPTESGYRAYFGGYSRWGRTEEEATAELRKKILTKMLLTKM